MYVTYHWHQVADNRSPNHLSMKPTGRQSRSHDYVCIISVTYFSWQLRLSVSYISRITDTCGQTTEGKTLMTSPFTSFHSSTIPSSLYSFDHSHPGSFLFRFTFPSSPRLVTYSLHSIHLTLLSLSCFILSLPLMSPSLLCLFHLPYFQLTFI